MKLEVQPIEAVILGFAFASLFVLSLYFWGIFEKKYPFLFYLLGDPRVTSTMRTQQKNSRKELLV